MLALSRVVRGCVCSSVVSESSSSSSSSSSFPCCVSAREQRQRRIPLLCRSTGLKSSAAMESTLKEMRDGASVLEMNDKSTVGGGVEDIYGEDRATEEQLVTPWTVSIASGYSLLRDPHFNKGLAFTEKERDAHYLRGLLPPSSLTQELQEKKVMQNLRQYQVPLQRYMALMDLQERNERLFYKLLIDHVEELLPIVYTPTVGEACQKYGSIVHRRTIMTRKGYVGLRRHIELQP